MGPIAPVYVGNSVLSLVTKTKLLGLIVDQKLTWVANLLETNKSFVKKMDFIKYSCFFTKKNVKGIKRPSDSSGC